VTRKADEVTRELDSQLDEMKAQLQRLRDERGTAVKRAEAVSKELDSLQARYESVVEKLHSGKGKAKEHDKAIELEMEVKGLMKEIVWLKARYSRELEMRRRLAWIKLNPLKAEEAGETWYGLLLRYLLETHAYVTQEWNRLEAASGIGSPSIQEQAVAPAEVPGWRVCRHRCCADAQSRAALAWRESFGGRAETAEEQR
jgi:chromosome segregation ATPase